MRTITLKTLGDLAAVDLLTQVVKQPLGSAARGGTVIEQMRLDIRLMDKLDAAQGAQTLDLEDADWGHLTTKLRAFPFGLADKRIVEICDDVFNATETK